MKCVEVMAWLLVSRAKAPSPLPVRRHLKECRRCRRWRRRLASLDEKTAHMPIPPQTEARHRCLELLAREPLPASGPRASRPWPRLLGSLAAALLLGFGLGFLTFRTGTIPDPPPVLANPGQELDDRLLARLVHLNLDLAQAYDAPTQLRLLTAMAAEVRGEAIRQAREGNADDLPLLGTLHDRILRRGIVGRSALLPLDRRAEQAARVGDQLRQGKSDVEKTALQLPPALADLLRPLADSADQTAQQLSSPPPAAPAAPDPFPTVTASGTSRDLIALVVAQSVFLVEEDDPLQRALVCNDVADRFSLAIRMASGGGDTDRAVKLGKQLDGIIDRGVNANLSRLPAGDPRVAELNRVVDRVRQLLAGLPAPAGGTIPYGQVKDLEHSLKEMEKALREIGKGKGDPHREIRGVVQSFDKSSGRLAMLVKDKGKEFEASFTLPADARIWGPGPRQRTLADLIPGARIRIIPREPGIVGELRVD
jgi:hypothetical protein